MIKCLGCGRMVQRLNGMCDDCNERKGGNQTPLTLDEWADQNEATRLLRDNLMTNLEELTDMTPIDRNDLLRLHLIMVRQFARQTGSKVRT